MIGRSSLKMEEKNTESRRNEDESQKTRNELKVSDLETYPLKNEERMKNDEEWIKTFTDLLTETSRKRYESTSAWIFFPETIFFTQNNWNI